MLIFISSDTLPSNLLRCAAMHACLHWRHLSVKPACGCMVPHSLPALLMTSSTPPPLPPPLGTGEREGQRRNFPISATCNYQNWEGGGGAISVFGGGGGGGAIRPADHLSPPFPLQETQAIPDFNVCWYYAPGTEGGVSLHTHYLSPLSELRLFVEKKKTRSSLLDFYVKGLQVYHISVAKVSGQNFQNLIFYGSMFLLEMIKQSVVSDHKDDLSFKTFTW